MILTCPECASRYFIDDQLIGRAGRTVRCQACGAAWKARLEDAPIELTATPDEGAFAVPPRAEPPAAEPGPALSELPADRLPGAFRAKAEQRRRLRGAALSGAVWAGLAAAFVLGLAAAVIFRADIVRALPRTASAYAAVGLPVNITGISIEKVEAQPGLQDGRPAVVVTGALRNVEKGPVAAPALRINLLNKAGKTVLVKIAAPGDARIPAGETRHFTVSLLDPPSTATDVEVVFEKAAPPRRKSTHAPAPRLRAAPPPAPVTQAEEIKPIEQGRFALPETANEKPGAPPAPAEAHHE